VRIVQIVESLNIGGLETMALSLAIAQQKAGHTSTIYTVFSGGDLEPRAREAGVAVVPFNKPSGFNPRAIIHMARQLRIDRVDVVHTHNSGIHHYGVAAGRLAGVPVIVNTRHGLAFHSGRRQEGYYRAVMPLTDAVVFVCSDGRRYYTECGTIPDRKGTVIANGIATAAFQAARATPGAVRPRIRFGTIGRLVKAKAHCDLVDAFALLAPRLPDAELQIWGDGDLRPAVQDRIVARGLGDRVRCMGVALNSAEVLRQLDVFVLSSISEGLPLVILEAMAAGLPIVSTRVGGVPEAAGEGVVALYCQPGDPQGLADTMFLAAGSDLAVMGEAASRVAAERFSAETMQIRYAELFACLLEKHRPMSDGRLH